MNVVLKWLDDRLSLRGTLGPMLMHPIPRGAAGPMGWWYVFGSASMTLLAIQVLSGIGLALVYVPSADQAYETLLYLNYQQPLGWFLRALHYWSGSAMVVMVVVHMTQVFLHAAHKYPRELNWLTGVLLLVMTLGMAFSGQVLRWDADAYWGVGVGASMAGRVPVLGPFIVRLLLGGPVIGSDTSESVLRPARLRDPRPAGDVPRGASLAGAQTRDQRAARTGQDGRSPNLSRRVRGGAEEGRRPFPR